MDTPDNRHSADTGQPGAPLQTPPRRQGKGLDDQIRELHRLVDGAMENLEQVHRALRFIERDC